MHEVDRHVFSDGPGRRDLELEPVVVPGCVHRELRPRLAALDDAQLVRAGQRIVRLGPVTDGTDNHVEGYRFRLRATGTGVTQVVDRHGERIDAGKAEVGVVTQAVHRRVDRRDRAGERHRGIGRSVADTEVQAAGQRKRQRAVLCRQRRLEMLVTGVDVQHRDVTDDQIDITRGEVDARPGKDTVCVPGTGPLPGQHQSSGRRRHRRVVLITACRGIDPELAHLRISVGMVASCKDSTFVIRPSAIPGDQEATVGQHRHRPGCPLIDLVIDGRLVDLELVAQPVPVGQVALCIDTPAVAVGPVAGPGDHEISPAGHVDRRSPLVPLGAGIDQELRPGECPVGRVALSVDPVTAPVVEVRSPDNHEAAIVGDADRGIGLAMDHRRVHAELVAGGGCVGIEAPGHDRRTVVVTIDSPAVPGHDEAAVGCHRHLGNPFVLTDRGVDGKLIAVGGSVGVEAAGLDLVVRSAAVHPGRDEVAGRVHANRWQVLGSRRGRVDHELLASSGPVGVVPLGKHAEVATVTLRTLPHRHPATVVGGRHRRTPVLAGDRRVDTQLGSQRRRDLGGFVDVPHTNLQHLLDTQAVGVGRQDPDRGHRNGLVVNQIRRPHAGPVDLEQPVVVVAGTGNQFVGHRDKRRLDTVDVTDGQVAHQRVDGNVLRNRRRIQLDVVRRVVHRVDRHRERLAEAGVVGSGVQVTVGATVFDGDGDCRDAELIGPWCKRQIS